MPEAASKTTTLSADLSLRIGDEEIRISGEGRRLVIDLPSLRAGTAMLRTQPFLGKPAARLAGADRALRRAGLTADVRLRGTPLARLGADARPGTLARLLSPHAVEVHPVRSVAASLRRRPGIAAAAAAAFTGLALTFFYVLRRR